VFIAICHTKCCQRQICPCTEPKQLNVTAASCNTQQSRTYALLQPDERGQTFSQLFVQQVSVCLSVSSSFAAVQGIPTGTLRHKPITLLPATMRPDCTAEKGYITCNDTNLMHCSSSVTTLLHASSLLVAHHQEVAMYRCGSWSVMCVLQHVPTVTYIHCCLLMMGY
jgi:hypothetical protein